MGLNIPSCEFDQTAEIKFKKKLRQNLEALDTLVKQSGFGEVDKDSLVFGAELELYIVDAQGQPVNINESVLTESKDPQLTLELNRYNLEYNLTPYSLAQQPFLSTENEIKNRLAQLDGIAKKRFAALVPIGILPTLTPNHFGPECMTDQERYHALVSQLKKRRGNAFEIDINGEQPLKMQMSDVTLEGANTSFQIHYRVEPSDFVNIFNALQLVTPLVLAVSANSPGIFGHSLWHETRIPLFKQAIDTRHKDRYLWCEPARVNFGHGWMRQSVVELFQETVNLFPPLLPVCGFEDSVATVKSGQVPKLEELRLHQSTVWWWNRGVYDDADGGHVRIEMRALPAGPTAADMAANAAFYIGMAESFKREMPRLIPALPFSFAEFNFYRAAQFGLDAKIIWPSVDQSECRQVPIMDVLKKCTSRAREGLASIGVSFQEIDRYMTIIEDRISNKQNGAVWQEKKIAQYRSTGVKNPHQVMLKEYMENSSRNLPVSAWLSNEM